MAHSISTKIINITSAEKKPIKKTKAQLAKEKKAAKLKEAFEKAKEDSLKKAGVKITPIKIPKKNQKKIQPKRNRLN
ncbi:MAG TPA: hypothetical protein PK509_15780 [Catalimonadaceae bacterium]|nr:hypothetical protein [Catalimonadaceae bacterium]